VKRLVDAGVTVINHPGRGRAAEPVRRQWIRDLLSRKSPPKGTMRFAVSEILAEPDRVGDGKDALLADLLHRPEPGYSYGRRVGAAASAEVTETRLPLLLLAQVAADREQTMSEATWRHANPTVARWFSFLASTGYTLADIEQRVVNDAHSAKAQDEAGANEAEANEAEADEADAADDHGDSGQWDDETSRADGFDPAA
jgi:ParB family chromosome partitioning protein